MRSRKYFKVLLRQQIAMTIIWNTSVVQENLVPNVKIQLDFVGSSDSFDTGNRRFVWIKPSRVVYSYYTSSHNVHLVTICSQNLTHCIDKTYPPIKTTIVRQELADIIINYLNSQLIRGFRGLLHICCQSGGLSCV